MTGAEVSDTNLSQQAWILAGPTRRRVFETIWAAPCPLDIATITEELGTHHTTVRSHLARLRDAGLVVEESDKPDGPGRPRLLYRVAPDVAGSSSVSDPSRRLALRLADALMADRTTNQERTTT